MGLRLKRQVPRWSDVWRFVGPSLQPSRRDRWSRVRTVDDFARMARHRTPRSVYDYVDGAAEGEVSTRRSVEAFSRLEFRPHVLRDVSAVDVGTTVLGRRISFPVVLGPHRIHADDARRW